MVDDRRGFIGSLLVLAAGAAAATMLGGCAEEEVDPVSAGPTEAVTPRAGMHHFNTVPQRIPSVRTFDLPSLPVTEWVSTKAM